MSLILKQFNSSVVKPKDDAVLYRHFEARDCVLQGCVITPLGLNNVQVGGGRLLVCGREIEIEQETIQVALSETEELGRLKIVIDTTNEETPVVFESETATGSLPALTQEDINASGTTYEVALATYDVGSTAISNLVPVLSTVQMPNARVEITRNITIPRASFVSNATYPDFPKSVDVSVAGLKASDYVLAEFDVPDAISNNYAPKVSVQDGFYRIYAVEVPSADLILATQVVIKELF